MRSSPANAAGAPRSWAGLHEVPIVPVEVSDSDALEIMIIENVQREDLNAMEEALGYHSLADEFKRSQEDIAKIVGKSRSHVANMMRLTKLPAEVQALISKGDLSAGHARALIGVPDPLTAAKRIVAEGLNVRQAEALAHEEGVPERKPQKARAGCAPKVDKDADTLALEKRVSDALGLAVTVSHRDPGGTVQINYRNLEQLDEVVRRLEGG
ncbi:ParB-like chromosome segregation protein Spo0J [Bradyrhizobium sp. USDA 4451]